MGRNMVRIYKAWDKKEEEEKGRKCGATQVFANKIISAIFFFLKISLHSVFLLLLKSPQPSLSSFWSARNHLTGNERLSFSYLAEQRELRGGKHSGVIWLCFFFLFVKIAFYPFLSMSLFPFVTYYSLHRNTGDLSSRGLLCKLSAHGPQPFCPPILLAPTPASAFADCPAN